VPTVIVLAASSLMIGVLLVRVSRHRSALAAAMLVVAMVMSVVGSGHRADAAEQDCFPPPTAPLPAGLVQGTYRTTSAVSGSSVLGSATITLIAAGPDQVLGTDDDITNTTTTAADGTYTFTGVPVGPARVVVAELPPSEEYSLTWFGENDRLRVSGTWGSGNALALGSTLHFSGTEGSAGTALDVAEPIAAGSSFSVEILGDYLIGRGTFAAADASRAVAFPFDVGPGCSGGDAVSVWALQPALQDITIDQDVATTVAVLAANARTLITGVCT
jgi:hypothetical protein